MTADPATGQAAEELAARFIDTTEGITIVADMNEYMRPATALEIEMRAALSALLQRLADTEEALQEIARLGEWHLSRALYWRHRLEAERKEGW